MSDKQYPVTSLRAEVGRLNELVAIQNRDMKAAMDERDQLRAEIERLTNQIGTWRGHTEETYTELLDVAKAEIDQLRAEVERLKVENGGAAWCMEWLVAEKFRKPDVPGIIKQSQKHYIKTLRENYRLRELLGQAKEGIDDYWITQPDGVKWLAAVDEVLGGG